MRRNPCIQVTCRINKICSSSWKQQSCMWAEKSKLDILLDAKILSSHLQWIQTTKHRLKILHFYINLPIFAIWWVAHITLHTTAVVANSQRLIKVINKKLQNQKIDEKKKSDFPHRVKVLSWHLFALLQWCNNRPIHMATWLCAWKL